MPRRSRIDLRFVATLVVAAVALGTVALLATREERTPVLASADVDPRGRKIPVARHFTGVSLEYRDVLPGVGSDRLTGGPDRVFARLLRNIGAAGNGTPVIRIGGGSQDAAWWNPRGRDRPPGVDFDITPEFIEALRDFQRISTSPLILGLNMAAGDPRIALGWARAALAKLGSEAVLALEIGNEPYHYPVAFSGRPPVRSSDWGADDYLAEFSVFAARLSRVRPTPPLAGPIPCCAPGWAEAAEEFVRREGPELRLGTLHSYPFCTDEPRPPEAVLAPGLTDRELRSLDPLLATARKAGLPVRVTETDPNACSGDPRFSAALWAVDWMFTLAAAGVRGADFHQIETSPFSVFYRNGRYEGSVSSLYYAMLLFSRAAPAGSAVLLDDGNRARTPHARGTAVWTTIGPDKTVRVMAVNKDADNGGEAVIRIRGAAASPGSLIRLRGPGLEAAGDVTLAGQSIPAGTTTGELSGDREDEAVRPDGEVYRFNLPAASAALLTVPTGP